MIAFLTALDTLSAYKRINAEWSVKKVRGKPWTIEIGGGETSPIVLIRRIDELVRLELATFYTLGDVPMDLQRAAWSRAGRWRPANHSRRICDGDPVAQEIQNAP